MVPRKRENKRFIITIVYNKLSLLLTYGGSGSLEFLPPRTIINQKQIALTKKLQGWISLESLPP